MIYSLTSNFAYLQSVALTTAVIVEKLVIIMHMLLVLVFFTVKKHLAFGTDNAKFVTNLLAIIY